MKPLRAPLEDMRRNCVKIGQFISGMNFEDFRTDPKTFYAVERAILIIGEAARRYESGLEKERAPNKLAEQIGERAWIGIKTIGNVIRHNYDDIDAEIIWKVSTVNVPELHQVIVGIVLND